MHKSTVLNLSISELAKSIAEKHLYRCASSGVEADPQDVASPDMFPPGQFEQAIKNEGLEYSKEDLMQSISAAIAELIAKDAAERAAYSAQLRAEANAYADAARDAYEANCELIEAKLDRAERAAQVPE